MSIFAVIYFLHVIRDILMFQLQKITRYNRDKQRKNLVVVSIGKTLIDNLHSVTQNVSDSNTELPNRCANFDGNHRANSSRCPIYVEKLDKRPEQEEVQRQPKPHLSSYRP